MSLAIGGFSMEDVAKRLLFRRGLFPCLVKSTACNGSLAAEDGRMSLLEVAAESLCLWLMLSIREHVWVFTPQIYCPEWCPEIDE
jgi:hypothetical protein